MECGDGGKVSCRICGIPAFGVQTSADDVTLTAQINVLSQITAEEGITVVSHLEAGDVKREDPARPSLILRRSGEERLWDLAKEYGSTVDKIMETNRLQGEPAMDQMLLIPLCE